MVRRGLRLMGSMDAAAGHRLEGKWEFFCVVEWRDEEGNFL